MFLRVCVPCLALLLSACGISPHRPMQYERESLSNFDSRTTPTQPEMSGSACVLIVRSVQDKRSNSERFGPNPKFKLFADSVPGWIESGVLALSDKGHRLVTAAVASEQRIDAAIQLDVMIHKAYI